MARYADAFFIPFASQEHASRIALSTSGRLITTWLASKKAHIGAYIFG
ncbi:MAG TPA: hypothetical protein VFG10_19030 [Saprospiraceae bacterium]|nr:hypothetical protein [Saprospiraceae bacterium]